MEPTSKLEPILKILTPLLTLITVFVGVFQFNAGQRENKTRELNMRQIEIDKMNNQLNREILGKFKENQNKVYSEAMSTIGYLATHKDHTSEKYQETLNRFNQLYWVELSSVATESVNKALLIFQNILNNLQNNQYRFINEKIYDLQDAAEKIAEAMRESSMDYSLPGGLKGLGPNAKVVNK